MSSIWDICIKRPVFTVMLVMAPIVLGLAAYNRLGVDLFPNVDIPTVVVTTTQKGAGVEEMETGVTKIIEEAVNTISGIDELNSTTREGFSQVVINFKLSKDGDIAAQEVRSKISTILNLLPVGTDPPVVDKFDVDAAPIMTIAIAGKRDPREVTELAKKRIKEDLETVLGVGSVVMVGARERAINIYLDVDKLTSYQLSAADVRQALLKQNLEIPGGRVDEGPQELVLRTMGRMEKPSDFAELIIADRKGYPVRIKDIGRVEDSQEEPRGFSRLDGSPAVSLIVQKQSGTNTVAVVHAVKERLTHIQKALPADISWNVILDQSRFIEKSIEEVKFHLMLAAVLVSLTILLFIRDWRTTLIATIAIPASMIPTFAFMMAMGYTMNNITMLGLILAIGIVIDDAVVVHENIFRHMEEHGLDAEEASRSATSEIATAVVATTLSLLVIFVPVAFMEGQVGRFFNSFGFVVGFSILTSMFVSFTLTPMLCAHFLVAEHGHATSKEGFFTWIVEGSYGWMLGWSLRYPWAIVAIAIGVLFSTPVIVSRLGFDFVPRDDQSEFELSMTLPEGYTLDRADKLIKSLEADVQKLPFVKHTFAIVGDTSGRVAKGQGDVTAASMYVRLAEMHERNLSQFEIMRQARELMKRYPDVRVAVQDVRAISRAGFRQVDLDLNIKGPNLDKLKEISDKVIAWMKSQDGRYVDVDSSLTFRKPELRVVIDRERASDLDIPIETIASTLNLLVGGEPIGKFKEGPDQYDVWVRADKSFRDKPHAIDSLMVPSPKVGLVRLSSLARLEPAQGPSTIERSNRQRQVVVVANLEGLALGQATSEVDAFMKTLELPVGYSHEFIGRAKLMRDSNAGFLLAFGLSFLFMYMVLAAQFESFVHPITILLALPLTLPFAFLSLLLLQTPIDIYAMFGIFMLFGIVKKNGILQIDYTNVLREQGKERNEAIMEANLTRLRPILMTTLMLVAAMIPVALGTGPGAGARASMAKVIIGGQALSLLLTLLVTPVAYSLWDDFASWWSRRVLGIIPPEERGDDSSPPAEPEATVVTVAAPVPASTPTPVTTTTSAMATSVIPAPHRLTALADER